MKLVKGKNSRHHKLYPAVKSGYPLTEHGWFGILVPSEMTNLITNPSFELGDANPGALTHYSAVPAAPPPPTTIAATQTVSRRGAWSLAVTPTSNPVANAGVIIQGVTLTVGNSYTYSLDFLGNAGHQYEFFAMRASGAIAATTGVFVANGQWQRLAINFEYSIGGDAVFTVSLYRRFPIANTTPFYIDGVLVTTGMEASTYFDGDTLGYGDEDAYIWLGSPHDSQSRRASGELSTGVIRELVDYNFDLLGYIGLGYIPQDKLLIQNALIGGASFQRGVDQVREYSLVGAIPARDHFAFMRNRKHIIDLLSDSVTLQQPLTVYCHLTDNCDDPVADPLVLTSLYDGGLEGNINNLYQERVSLQFTMPVPQLMVDGEEGGDINTYEEIAADYMAKRIVGDGWDDWDSGANGGVACCRFDPSTGRVYVGGNFSQVGSAPLAATRICYWNIQTQAFAVLNAQFPNNWVYAIETRANWDMFMGGAFTNVGGLPITAYLAQWDYDSLAWGGGFGLTYPCYDLQFSPGDDILYSVGYAAGGGEVRQHIIGGASSTIGTVAAGQSILGVEVDRNGKVYVTGNFNTISGVSANGIAVYDPDAASWSALGDGLQNAILAQAPGYGLQYGDDGNLYVIGAFVYADGVECNSIAGYNGDSFFALGRGLGLTAISSAPWHMAYKDGVLYVPHINTAAGFVAATGDGGNTTAKYIATWDGTNWSSLDILLNGTIDTVELDSESNLYIGCRTAKATTPVGESSVLTNSGTALAYPVFKFQPTAMSNDDNILAWIKNETTDQTIYLNINLINDEIITIDLRPGRKLITSTLRGNLNNKIWPSSDFASFHLAPGDNYITVYVDSEEVPAHVYWQIAHDYIDGAIYE